MIELVCPESCPYLINARATALERERESRKKEASAIGAPDLSLNQRALICVQAIEGAILAAARGTGELSLRDIDDTEILATLENALKNLETEETGLIYEHRAPTPRIEQLSRRIRETLDETSKEIPAEARPRRGDMVKAMSFLRETVRAHIQPVAG
ncbi:MAG TPA: hypothetical protein VKF81_04530, partial [Blastocatellia bacterium]|nr:hypothetical protein [Blastocatellia bacterium]